MKLVVRGWGRDHGETVVANRDLETAQVGEVDRYYPSKAYITPVPEVSHPSRLLGRPRVVREAGVAISFDAKIILNGQYLVRHTFSKREIAKMFFLAHSDCTIEELFDLFSTLGPGREAQDDVSDPQQGPTSEVTPAMCKKVSDLNFYPQTAAAFKNERDFYVGDLIQMTEAEFLRIPGLGHKALVQVKKALASMDLHFGMGVPKWRDKLEELTKPS